MGDWTVDVDIKNDEGQWVTDDFGTFVGFAVQPGEAVVVTFTNIPGYAAQPPSGEVILPDEPAQQ